MITKTWGFPRSFFLVDTISPGENCASCRGLYAFSKSAADDTQRVRVKICGITREDDVVAAVDAGADAVGFIVMRAVPALCRPQGW